MSDDVKAQIARYREQENEHVRRAMETLGEAPSVKDIETALRWAFLDAYTRGQQSIVNVNLKRRT